MLDVARDSTTPPAGGAPFPDELASPRARDRLVNLRLWLPTLVFIGVAWRIGRWALGMPLWRDEANLGLNLLRRSFADLTMPLDYFQVAPLLFLWVQKAVILVLGAGDRAVRLVPTLASVVTVLLFARLAGRRLAPLAAAIATGFLACSYYAARYGSELKPYSIDLLASVVILGLTLDWLDRPRALLPIVLLLVATPLLIGASYPAVFVAGAAGLVLAARALQERQPTLVFLACLYLLVTAGAFLLFFHLAAAEQDRVTGPGMRIFWADAFPPANPWRVPLWLVDVHTGNLTAYPAGGRYGGSTPTFLLMIAGVVALWHARQRRLLWLLLLPFGLNLAAATLHRYPYGDSPRIAQHLAPGVCFLAGCGAAALLDRIPKASSWSARAPSMVLAFLSILGVVGLAVDLSHPYKTLPDLEARRVVASAFSRHPDRRVLVLGEVTDVRYLWYLTASRGTAVFDPPQVALTGDSVSALVFSQAGEPERPIEELLDARGSEFVLREDAQYRFPLDSDDVRPASCRSLLWVRRGSAVER